MLFALKLNPHLINLILSQIIPPSFPPLPFIFTLSPDLPRLKFKIYFFYVGILMGENVPHPNRL